MTYILYPLPIIILVSSIQHKKYMYCYFFEIFPIEFLSLIRAAMIPILECLCDLVQFGIGNCQICRFVSPENVEFADEA